MLRTTVAGVAIALLASICTVRAQAQVAERFTFAVPNAPESTVDGKGRLTLTLNRWSTDAERDAVVKIVQDRGAESLLDAFRETGAIGYLRWPGGLEYAVRYAHRASRPDGGSDVVLVVDRPLWVWWPAGAEAGVKPTEGRFGIVHVRFDKSGRGEGRVASGNEFATDKQLGVLMTQYESKPVLLTDVRRES